MASPPGEDLETQSVYEKPSTRTHPTPPRPREEDERGRRDAKEGESPGPRDCADPPKPVEPQGMGPDPSETACGSCAPSSYNPPKARERRKPPRAPRGGGMGAVV